MISADRTAAIFPAWLPVCGRVVEGVGVCGQSKRLDPFDFGGCGNKADRMNVDLAQKICLISHGSVWLRNPVDPAPRLESMSIFEHVTSIGFEFERSPGDTLEAPDSATWMTQLAEREVDRLWLVFERSSRPEERPMTLLQALFGRRKPPPPPEPPPPPTIAFAGGGAWAVLASSSRGQELWRGSSDMGDDKSWRIMYKGTPISDVKIEPPAIGAAQAKLLAALGGARRFAAGQDQFWAGKFSEALALAHQDTGLPDTTLLPRDGYSQAARRLFAISAEASDVFGGMGSWGDQTYPGSDYREVTDRLFAASENGFVSAVNSPLEARVH